MARLRRITQILFLLFFLFLFLQAHYPYEVDIPSDIFLRFSPLIPLFYFIDTLHVAGFFWPALIILLLTPFIGRFFCGWICPLGSSLDIFSRIVPGTGFLSRIDWNKLRWVKFALLSSLFILALFSLHLWGYFDPMAIFTRFTTVIFHPLFTRFAESSLLSLMKISFLEEPLSTVYEWYKTAVMPEKQPHLQEIFTVFLLILFIFGTEKITRRFWCRYICPTGALLGFLSQFRLYERIVSASCPVCHRCDADCRMAAIPADNVALTDKVECIECFSCAEKCPPNHKSITYRFRLSPYRSAPDFSRRQFVGSLAGGIATLGLFGIGFAHKNKQSRMIRPPGALPEDDFLDRCIRCMECVRICESNGGCLQPAGFDASLVNLWTPVARMREGYCEYNCNLCGQVCPTDAILPLSLTVKKNTPMGLAYFDKNLCIPYVQNENCIVCEEHCPTPEKAIKFELREVTLPDGSKRTVKFPYVIRNLCIGCGICEYKCPVPDRPGIFVVRENEKRLERVPDATQPDTGWET